jgi:hypothetical protein
MRRWICHFSRPFARLILRGQDASKWLVKKQKWSMTPTPLKKRQEAAQGVFAGPLDQKKGRQSERRRCQRRQGWSQFCASNVPRIRRPVDRQFDAVMFRKPERTPVRGANAWPMKKEGTPDL